MTATNEERVLRLLEKVGAEKRAAARARPPGVPGRAMEPRWSLDYLHAEANRGRGSMSRRGLRRALDQLVKSGQAEVEERTRGGLAWGLPPRWDGWDG